MSYLDTVRVWRCAPSFKSPVTIMYEAKSVYSMLDTSSTSITRTLLSPQIHATRSDRFRGPTPAAFLEWLTPLSPYSSTLSVLLNENGGIIDDTIITKHSEDAFYVVTNAGKRDRDLVWFAQKMDEWNNDSSKGGGCWLCKVPRRPSTCKR